MADWIKDDVITAARLNDKSVLPGMVMAYGGSSAPNGWLLCNGSAVSRTTYADLFSIIGTTFGVGDGSTTFNLPDLMGRMILGAGAGSGLSPRSVGNKSGTESHNHAATIWSSPGPTGAGYMIEAANHINPFTCLNYIIKI